MSCNNLAKYRGYVLYGQSLENLVQRVLAFLNGCGKLVADTPLSELVSKLCTEKPTTVELKDCRDVDRVIASSEEGKALVFVVEAPKEGVHALALVPVDKFNKARAGGG